MTTPVLYDPSTPPRGSKTHTQCDDVYCVLLCMYCVMKTQPNLGSPGQEG